MFKILKNNLWNLWLVLFIGLITTFNYGGGCGEIGNGVISGSSVSAPLVTTRPATEITETSAKLNGTVINPNGIATTVYFNYQPECCQYGVLATPLQRVQAICETAEVWAPIDGLSPNTTYSFRFVATNAIGTTYGGNLTFTTSN